MVSTGCHCETPSTKHHENVTKREMPPWKHTSSHIPSNLPACFSRSQPSFFLQIKSSSKFQVCDFCDILILLRGGWCRVCWKHRVFRAYSKIFPGIKRRIESWEQFQCFFLLMFALQRCKSSLNHLYIENPWLIEMAMALKMVPMFSF